MTGRKRRNDEIDEVEANRSDSNDGDYDERQARASTKKAKRSHKPSSKRSRRARPRGDDSDVVSDADSLLADSLVEDSYEELEVDPRTGRSKRKRVQTISYDVDKTSEEDSPSSSNDEQDEAEIDDSEQEHLRKLRKTDRRAPSKVITLKIPATRQSARNTRTRSRQASAEPLSAGTRRSSRFKDEQDIIALSPSGKHSEIISRSRTTTPEVPARRLSTSRKGLKKPTTSMIEEVSEESSDPHPVASGDAAADLPDTGVTVAENQENTKGEESSSSDEEAVEQEAVVEEEDVVQKQVTKDVDEVAAEADDEDDDDDEEDQPLQSRTRASRHKQEPARSADRKKKDDDESEFEAAEEEEGEDLSDSDHSNRKSPAKRREDEEETSGSNRRSLRPRRNGNTSRDSPGQDEDEELEEELEELTQGKRRARRAAAIISEPILRDRRGKQVDYRVFRTEALQFQEDDDAPVNPSPNRRARGAANSGWQRTLFPTSGPFGGSGGLPSVFGGPGTIGAAGGVDSDSSDDERQMRPPNVGPGMTPTSAFPPGLLPSIQTHSADPLQTTGSGGTPANLGKIKDRQALADADPLGVDANVSFDNVGGLDGHINQLQEMVALPLLYPEVFSRFKVTPPRGVLFHGPPGTGKTLLARALANSVSSHGRKVTFYMRKGADALSKWVGEAERQLRMLFEEARKTQPSIIFFDEIDGLAPVRSSKQEQIHASIVSTLLALMDGMDGRGQVIVIGATNRPDSVDPALRRPGRFDREFYFPLPSVEARRSILEIHTKGWQPSLSDSFKNELADVTKGYGGADLRALCTEAALNAVQRRYPQIYKSKEKLIIDPTTINVTAKDFMISVKKLIPSSERSASSGSAPLPKAIEPLLHTALLQIQKQVGEIMPRSKQRTALEEAEWEDDADPNLGFLRERLQQDFEVSRVFRPRLLIHGKEGMGQQYLAAAILNHFEGFHVQSFDLPTLLSDSARSPEAAVVQLFTESKRHKPAVIFLPSVNTWCATVGPTVVTTFLNLLRSIPPTDPVLVLGFMEGEIGEEDEEMITKIFGSARSNRMQLERPGEPNRTAYFEPVLNHLKRSPDDFPDPAHRKKRKLEELRVAPPPPPKVASKEELAAQKKRDRQTLNLLKIRIQPIMDQIKQKYRNFRNPPVDIAHHPYLYEEADPDIVVSDLPQEGVNRPYEKGVDKDGNPGLRDTLTKKFLYNMDTTTIEERLSNGYYCRPRDFFRDINFLAKDARALEDRNKMIKANELVANVDVDVAMFETEAMFADCENIYKREVQRKLDLDRKAAKKQEDEETAGQRAAVEAQARAEQTIQPADPPVRLGMPAPSTPSRLSQPSSQSNGIRSGVSNAADGGSFSHLPSNGAMEIDGGESYVASQSQNQSQNTQTPASQHIWGLPPPQAGLSSLVGSSSQRSQQGLLTTMPPGSQVEDFVNNASTTSSGNKTTSDSHPSSGPSRVSNGVGGYADPTNPPSQPDPAASSRLQVASIPALLNSTTASLDPKLVQVNQRALEVFGGELVARTSGCSVEQLQLVNARLMDLIWKTRGAWNRTEVLIDCADLLEVTMEELGTEVGESSSSRTKRAVEAALRGQLFAVESFH
ncbi:MAG: hypothetical protein M1814_003489 [Vezdaea aestivalis]|nr:MAG: hypothetical protein M1814_003489 [Vezdaea aestivalis]